MRHHKSQSMHPHSIPVSCSVRCFGCPTALSPSSSQRRAIVGGASLGTLDLRAQPAPPNSDAQSLGADHARFRVPFWPSPPGISDEKGSLKRTKLPSRSLTYSLTIRLFAKNSTEKMAASRDRKEAENFDWEKPVGLKELLL